MIGAKRVAISRALVRLRAAGAVEVKKRHIYLKDGRALERIASKQKQPPLNTSFRLARMPVRAETPIA